MNNNIKSSFDEFNPTDEQKLKMLNNIQSKAYATKVFDFKRIYIPMACATAAAFIFVVGGGIFNNQPQQNTDVPQIVKVTPDVPVEKPLSDDNTSTPAETKANYTPDVQPKESSTKSEQKSEFEQVFESVDNNKPIETTQTLQLVLNDTPDNAQSPMARNMVEPASFEQDETAIEYKDVTYNEFCDELGYDIATTVKVPDDMQNITQTENSMPVDDAVEWDVTFIGDGARCININASTDMTKYDEYINGDYKKTDVNGNEAVIFFDENYTAYMNTESAGYKITTIEITEQELSEVLVSIAK